MGKTVILYASTEHKNTERLVKGIADSVQGITLINVLENKNIDISSYEFVGFASGIYFGRMHDKIMELLETLVLKPDQKSFVLCTCGAKYTDHAKTAKYILTDRGFECLGSYVCKGYDTYGLLKYIGGISRGRPNANDIRKGAEFVRNAISR